MICLIDIPKFYISGVYPQNGSNDWKLYSEIRFEDRYDFTCIIATGSHVSLCSSNILNFLDPIIFKSKYAQLCSLYGPMITTFPCEIHTSHKGLENTFLFYIVDNLETIAGAPVIVGCNIINSLFDNALDLITNIIKYYSQKPKIQQFPEENNSSGNTLLVKTYDRMSKRVQVNHSQLKQIYSELTEKGFTLDTISKQIGCSFRNSLYRGYSLNKDSFKKLQDLYGKEISFEMKDPIVPHLDLEINEYLVEQIGIILGDGHLSKSGNTLTITLNFEDEENYVEYVKDLLRKVFNVDPSIVKLPNNKANQIRIYGKGIINALVELGMKTGNKVKNQVSVPDWIKNKKKLCASCLKGLLDTDGSIYLTSDKRRLAMNFKNNSKPLVESFIEMCEKLDIKTNNIYEGWTFSRGKRFKHYKVEIYKQDQIARFILIVNPEKWKNRKRKFLEILTKNGSSWSSVFNDILTDLDKPF